ncbi:hypothetical protein HYW61_01850 [candidate division WWE3 bacterium]|nr:hypothetical protein [candidate division WWE3 bacterium]
MYRLYQPKNVLAFAFIVGALFEGVGVLATFTSFPQLIGQAGSVLFPAIIGLGFFMIIKAGYTLLTSEGDPEAVKKGKEDLTSAIIGLIFVLLSMVILKIIIGNLISEDIFS